VYPPVWASFWQLCFSPSILLLDETGKIQVNTFNTKHTSVIVDVERMLKTFVLKVSKPMR